MVTIKARVQRVKGGEVMPESFIETFTFADLEKKPSKEEAKTLFQEELDDVYNSTAAEGEGVRQVVEVTAIVLHEVCPICDEEYLDSEGMCPTCDNEDEDEDEDDYYED